jgi:hypothetical protein
VTKNDIVTKLRAWECFTHLSYIKDQQNEQRKQLQRNSR